MGVDERLKDTRARLSEINREFEARSALLEEQRAQEDAEDEARRQEKHAQLREEHLARKAEKNAEQESTSGWPQRPDQSEEVSRFGFEDDEELHEQSTGTSTQPPRPRPEPTHRIRPEVLDDDDDFSGVSWISG